MADAVPSLIGPCKLVASGLPADGEPMLLLDDNGRPVVVSVSDGDGTRAVTDGLSAMAALAEHGPWLNKLCPTLPDDTPFDDMQLIAVAPEIPAAMKQLGEDSRITLATCRAVRVGGEVALLLESISSPKSGPIITNENSESSASSPKGRRYRFRTGQVRLSGEESTFFDGP